MINQRIGYPSSSSAQVETLSTKVSNSNGPNNIQGNNPSAIMDMSVFLKLLAAQLQNQDPMNPSSQDTYLMQMAQMAVVQSITAMQETTITTYAASLVGKEVTVAKFHANSDEVTKIVGTVTGVGFFANQPIIYVDGEPFGMSQLMAVGKIPENPESDEKPQEGTDGKDELNNIHNDNKSVEL